MVQAMEWSQESQTEDEKAGVSEAINTTKQFSRMATDTIKCLTFTFNSHELSSNGHMPVLDTKMWLGMEQMTTGIPEAIKQA